MGRCLSKNTLTRRLVSPSVICGADDWVAVPADTNEIAVLPQLFKLLGLSGCLVTMDVAHCQTENTRLITAQGGDNVFALNANQTDAFEQVEHTFEHTDYSIV